MATRLSIRDNLRSELKIDPNGRIWSDAVLNRNIDIARRKIQQDGNYDWHFNDGESSSIVSVVGTLEYDLPTDFVRLELLKYSTWELTPTTKQYLLKTNQALTTNGSPAQYYLLGTKFGVWQRPDTNGTAFTMIYRKKLAAFSSDASTEVMPDEFIEAIIQYAAYLTWNDVQGREDKAIQAMQNYKEIMEGLNEQYLGRRQDSNFNWSFETINA